MCLPAHRNPRGNCAKWSRSKRKSALNPEGGCKEGVPRNMKIINTYPQIKSCYQDGVFDKKRWDTYIDSLLPAFKPLAEQDAADYDFDSVILPVLNAVPQMPDKLREASENFDALTAQVDAIMRRQWDVELDAVIVFCLGLCNGAGWVTELEGTTYILCGAEKILELNWGGRTTMAGLIYHELGHAWHFQTRRTPAFEEKAAALWQLYTEGVAMYAEQVFMQDYRFYHQDKNGWLAWCDANRQELLREYERRALCGESVQCFFGDWVAYENHSDVGYYLGCELVRDALRDRTLHEVLNASQEEVAEILKRMTRHT